MSQSPDPLPALVIGGGPAGLSAAEVLSAARVPVLLAEAKPSVARKFLMAGKSGLNLTKDEDPARFRAAFGAAPLDAALSDFGPEAVKDWAEGLGQTLFTGSTGRVFPTAMKASPLLRAWLARLTAQGVTLRTRWRWTGWDGAAALFETPEGPQRITARATVLALGGASWARLGSDGAWTAPLAEAGAPLAPFAPSNVGLRVDWSAHMHPHFGAPLKGIALHAGALSSRGEVVLSERGIEGGGIYPLTPALRTGAALTIDLLPDRSERELAALLAQKPRKVTLTRFLKSTLRLTPAKVALFHETKAPATALKALPLAHQGPRPLDEAISTAGGLRFDGLNAWLMLQSRPGVFCAGEMLDWDAPTGGYLLTGSMATGRRAGTGALDWLKTNG